MAAIDPRWKQKLWRYELFQKERKKWRKDVKKIITDNTFRDMYKNTWTSREISMFGVNFTLSRQDQEVAFVVALSVFLVNDFPKQDWQKINAILQANVLMFYDQILRSNIGKLTGLNLHYAYEYGIYPDPEEVRKKAEEAARKKAKQDWYRKHRGYKYDRTEFKFSNDEWDDFQKTKTKTHHEKPRICKYRKLLGLGAAFTQQELKTSYRRAASAHHPDKGGSVEKMQEVNNAYEQLKGQAT